MRPISIIIRYSGTRPGSNSIIKIRNTIRTFLNISLGLVSTYAAVVVKIIFIKVPTTVINIELKIDFNNTGKLNTTL
jgi:hypothetical protein